MASDPTRTRSSARLAAALCVAACAAYACSSSDAPSDTPAGSDAGGPIDGAVIVEAGGGDAAADAGEPPSCITPATPVPCVAPSGNPVPVCKLSLTGCVDPKDVTKLTAAAVPYEVNSPLWSDNAAKSRAFVLPAGGKIHVKDCKGDAGASAECTSPGGIPNGEPETGKWVMPVGTVLIKNFEVDGKLLETRLLMRVDPATAANVANGTDWVGYNYAWNEAQTEATLVPNARTHVSFDTGKQKVPWTYPSFLDCAGCHAAAVGSIGLETDQMNRVVGTQNQIDTFVAAGYFDGTAPKKPYADALVEPYANAALGLKGPPAGTSTEKAARSYLAANCGFCHRPDVNDQGFDLRNALTFKQVGICNADQQNGIPGQGSATIKVFAPGDHAKSALWQRMNTPLPASDPTGVVDVGRMPSVGSAIVDPQGAALIASWIDGVKSCP